jgi:hypothetical protein
LHDDDHLCRGLNLLNGNHAHNKAAALRLYAAHPHEALALVRAPPEN